MERAGGSGEIERLEALGASEPGSAAFPALAEAYRRAGRADEARKLAEEGLRHRPELMAGRVALALAHLDLGHPDAARTELERVLAEVPDHAVALRTTRELDAAAGAGDAPEEGLLGGIDDDELEDAFENAEARRDEMIDANHVAEAALHAVEDGGPEGVWMPEADSPFATGTVADLLERQGHPESARELRGALSPEAPPAPGQRERILATLERWLDNLRRRSL